MGASMWWVPLKILQKFQFIQMQLFGHWWAPIHVSSNIVSVAALQPMCFWIQFKALIVAFYGNNYLGFVYTGSFTGSQQKGMI